MRYEHSDEPRLRFVVLTLFPDLIRDAFSWGMTGRAMADGLLSLDTVNIRDYPVNAYGSIDDEPYGGGAGMLMMCEPVRKAYEEGLRRLERKSPRVIYMDPGGERLTEEKALELSKEEGFIILCGHYEGIDERVLLEVATDRISIGDYVLTGGELPALVLMDAVSRLVPGVLHNEESAMDESFGHGLLEYPQYTRPRQWHGMEVPQELLSGDHKKVSQYREREARRRTQAVRPDLYEKYLRDRGIW